jgi:phage replication-related protein YjqB (UPF0714/DUF867 family)
MDRYRNFQDLAANESAFCIDYHDRGSDVTICAPHGGNIEPHTSQIARMISGNIYNLYCLNGDKSGSNKDLHITSHRFDDDRALQLLSKAAIVITIHGCTEKKEIVYCGGLDTPLIETISLYLREERIYAVSDDPRYAGKHPDNLCNRGLRRRGVQLEISRGIRDDLTARQKTAAAVRSAIRDYKDRERQGSYLSPSR